MSKLSAIVITKNEEKNIERCLTSLDGVVDEILVLDSGSTDSTKDLASKFNVNYIETAWRGYAGTKNYGHELAGGDFILSLDADEALSDDLRKSILAVKDKLNGVYEFNRLNNYYGKFLRRGGFYPDRKIRLFDKKYARWIGDGVHETLDYDAGIIITRLSGDLFHYTYSSLKDHIDRQDKYARMAAEKLKTKSSFHLKTKSIYSPPWRFFSSYIIKLGFLEGSVGFTAAKMHARDAKVKCKYALELK